MSSDGDAGADTETNRLKNRKDVPISYHEVSFDALANLPYPNASTTRKNWTQAEKAAIAPFEGVPISVVGFIVAVKKQHGGGGETTNCHFNTVDKVRDLAERMMTNGAHVIQTISGVLALYEQDAFRSPEMLEAHRAQLQELSRKAEQ